MCTLPTLPFILLWMEPLASSTLVLSVLTESVEEVREGGGGRGFPSSLPNSLNSLSRPGCICLAIMGKLFSRSPNDFISFFLGEAFSIGVDVSAFGDSEAWLLLIRASVIVMGSNAPISGLVT